MNTLTALALAVSLAQARAVPAKQPPPAAQAPSGPQAAAPAAPAPAEAITLEQALEAAAKQNLDLRAAQARLRQSKEASWKAWSGYLPQVNLSGAYTRNQFEATITLPTGFYVREFPSPEPGQPPDSTADGAATNFRLIPAGFAEAIIQKQDQLAGQAEVSQVLFSPPLWFAIRAAYAGEDVASATVDGVKRDILFGVAQAFYGVSSLRRLMQVTEQLLEIAQRQERDSRVRFQAGTIAKVGLLRTEIDRARAEQDLKRARNSYESARLGLALLLNRALDFDIADPPEPALPPNPSELEDAAVRDRSEVHAARANVTLARAARNAAMARYLPSVAAFGRYQLSNIGGFTGENGQWAVGVGAQWQILDGGLRESDIREGNAKMDEAIAAAASTEQKVRNEVRQALLDLDSARANAAKAKEQRDLAAENQRLVDVSYRAGAATAVEQADATAQLRNAETGYTAESLAANLAALRVLRAAGAFKPTR
jgi:outer membrane protein TolC